MTILELRMRPPKGVTPNDRNEKRQPCGPASSTNAKRASQMMRLDKGRGREPLESGDMPRHRVGRVSLALKLSHARISALARTPHQLQCAFDPPPRQGFVLLALL